MDVLKMLVGVLQHYQKNSMVGKNEMQVKVGIIWNNIFFLLEKNDFLKYEIYSKETYMNLLYIGLISILIHANMLKVMSQILGLLLRNQLDCTKNVSGSVANIARLSFIIKQIVWLAKMKCKGPRNTYFKFYLTKNLRNISDSITVCNYNLAFHQAVVNSHLVVNELQIFESESNSQIFVTGN